MRLKQNRGLQVPVSTAFAAKCPNAAGVEWKLEKEGGKSIYEPDFKFNGKEIEAGFNSTGTFIREE